MSSKTSSTRFWHYVALIVFMAVAQVGCGGGGGSDGGGAGSPGGPDTTAPTFGGLTSASSQNGNVILTAAEGSDDSPKSQLQYLIYVSEALPVDRSGAPHATFTGANCANDTCTFQINDLDKSGTKTYFFASRAKDAAGNVDGGAHAAEDAGLSVTPEAFTDPTNPNPDPNNPAQNFVTLNKEAGKHAVHPSLTVFNGTPYVLWEECDPVVDTTTPKPNGWAADHPCSDDAASNIYMARLNTSGATPAWEIIKSKTAADNLNVTAGKHSEHPALTADAAAVYASWRETKGTAVGSGEQLYVEKYNGTGWETIADISALGKRPALTRHSVLGQKLGIAYEASPGQNSQIFFRSFENGWSGSTSLNVDPARAAEAPAFSRNGSDLFLAWKEYVQVGKPKTIPNVFVRQYSNGSWTPISQSLNFNSTMEARIPAIDLLGSTPYVVWQECLEDACNNEHIFVKHWDGGAWVQDKDTGTCPTLADINCGSLNHHSDGPNQIPSVFAKNPSITTGGDKVTVVWSERDDSTSPPKYKIRRKTLNGNAWTFNGTLSSNDAHWPVVVSDGNTLYIAWTEKDANGILQLHVAKR